MREITAVLWMVIIISQITGCKTEVYNYHGYCGSSQGYLIRKKGSINFFYPESKEARFFKFNLDENDNIDSLNYKSIKSPYREIDLKYNIEIKDEKEFRLMSGKDSCIFRADTIQRYMSNIPLDDMFKFSFKCIDCNEILSYSNIYLKDSILLLRNHPPIEMALFKIESENGSDSLNNNVVYFGFEKKTGAIVYISYIFDSFGYVERRIIFAEDKKNIKMNSKKIKKVLF